MTYIQQAQSFGHLEQSGLGEFGWLLSSKQKRIAKGIATGGMSEVWRHRKKIGKALSEPSLRVGSR